MRHGCHYCGLDIRHSQSSLDNYAAGAKYCIAAAMYSFVLLVYSVEDKFNTLMVVPTFSVCRSLCISINMAYILLISSDSIIYIFTK